jgi:hypothetical protein
MLIVAIDGVARIIHQQGDIIDLRGRMKSNVLDTPFVQVLVVAV